MSDPIDMDIKKIIIKKQACFSKLTDEETEVLASLLTEKHAALNEIIVKEGDPVDSVYFIVSGIADVKQAPDKDHPDQLQSIATLSLNDAIGLNERGFYSISGIRTATVVALTDMVLLRLSVAAFHGFALAYSHVTEVMRQHAQGLLNVNS